MKETLVLFLLYFSAIGCGINAGLFFIFSNTVMNAFSKLKPHEGIAAMQQINRVILNPLFFLVFFGTAVSSLLLLILVFVLRWPHADANPILIGSLLYLVGSILVTITCNVPRNEALDKLDPNSDAAKNLWVKYLKEWTAWNHIRTVACTLALLFFIFAL